MVSQVAGQERNKSEYRLTTSPEPYGFGVRLVGLDVLTRETGLPRATLARLAKQGQIPCLRLGGRMRFNLQAVNTCLLRMAEHAQVDPDADIPEDDRIPY